MIITVILTADDVELLSALPRGHEYEIGEYDDGVVQIVVHDLDDVTAALTQSLDTHPGVEAWVLHDDRITLPQAARYSILAYSTLAEHARSGRLEAAERMGPLWITTLRAVRDVEERGRKR